MLQIENRVIRHAFDSDLLTQPIIHDHLHHSILTGRWWKNLQFMRFLGSIFDFLFSLSFPLCILFLSFLLHLLLVAWTLLVRSLISIRLLAAVIFVSVITRAGPLFVRPSVFSGVVSGRRSMMLFGFLMMMRRRFVWLLFTRWTSWSRSASWLSLWLYI